MRINPDLFSAEYDKPPYQGGRIEIYTKPGADAFHGSGFFNFNGAAFNARDPFAEVRAPSQTRRYGLQLGGPIVRRRAGFYLDFEKRDINDYATLNALILNNNFQPSTLLTNVFTPKRLLIGSARADWQLNSTNVFVARYDFNSNRLDNQGIGGFDLPERAFNGKVTEHELRFTETAVLSRSMFNEARLGLSLIRQNQQAISNAPAITVLGAFNAGGATFQALARDERRIEIADNLSLTTHNHSLKFGA